MVIGEGKKSKIKNQKAKLQIKIQKSVSRENSSTGSLRGAQKKISHGLHRLSRAKEVKFVRIELIEGVRFLRLTAEDKFDTLPEHLKQAPAGQYMAR
jgi:hypothetical protein